MTKNEDKPKRGMKWAKKRLAEMTDKNEANHDDLAEIALVLFDIKFLETSMRSAYEARRTEMLGKSSDFIPVIHCHGISGPDMDNLPLPVQILRTAKERRALARTAGSTLGEIRYDLDFIMFETLGYLCKIDSADRDKFDGVPPSEMPGSRECLLVSGTTLDGRQLSLTGQVTRVGVDGDNVKQGPITAIADPELQTDVMDYILDSVRMAYVDARVAKLESGRAER